MEADDDGLQSQPPVAPKPLKAGDTVRFTIDTEQKAIVKIREAETVTQPRGVARCPILHRRSDQGARHVCQAIFDALSVVACGMGHGPVALTGCAASTPPTLTTQHPAHPEAMVAPELPPSTTLAYTPADIPSARPAVATAPRGAESASSSEHKGAHTVIGEGKVIAVVPASSEIVLTHGEIQGFMDAMTMGYRDSARRRCLQGCRPETRSASPSTPQQKAIVTLEKLQPVIAPAQETLDAIQTPVVCGRKPMLGTPSGTICVRCSCSSLAVPRSTSGPDSRTSVRRSKPAAASAWSGTSARSWTRRRLQEVHALLADTLTADGAIQVALLNNRELQATVCRAGRGPGRSGPGGAAGKPGFRRRRRSFPSPAARETGSERGREFSGHFLHARCGRAWRRPGLKTPSSKSRGRCSTSRPRSGRRFIATRPMSSGSNSADDWPCARGLVRCDPAPP